MLIISHGSIQAAFPNINADKTELIQFLNIEDLHCHNLGINSM